VIGPIAARCWHSTEAYKATADADQRRRRGLVDRQAGSQLREHLPGISGNGADDLTRATNPGPPLKTNGTELLTGIIENTESPPRHEPLSPARPRCGAYTLRRAEVQNCAKWSCPKCRALRCQRPRAGIPLGDVRVRFQPFVSRPGGGFTSHRKSQREIQSLRDPPFVLSKTRRSSCTGDTREGRSLPLAMRYSLQIEAWSV